MTTTSGPARSSAAPGAGPADPVRRRSILWPLLALVAVPALVSAALLVFDIGSSYLPAADLALIEMQVRDVGREAVLTGLYSREDWSHPGPAQFYVLAPFYWLTGGASVGLYLGALAVNLASFVGMVIVARRRGGTPLLLMTLLAGSLLMRTLGADFLRDPWNCYLTVLPFGLVVFLVWSLTARDVWALPWAVGATSFVAQAHVGYVVLGLPLLALGVLWLGVGVLRDGDGEQRRRLIRAALVAGLVGAVLWLPLLIDVVRNAPSNLGNIVEYFQSNAEEAHTIGDGWNVLSAQFSALPEWLTWHRTPIWFSGEPPSLYEPPLPLLLAFVAVAGVALWKRRISDARLLVVTWAATVGLGIIAIARTIGPAFDYRLRWTWVLGMVAFVIITWGAWSLVSSRWDRAGRVLGPVAVALIVAVTGANVVSALDRTLPYESDHEVLSALVPGALRAVEGADGEVLVTDTLAGSWYTRGIVLQLERHGSDVRVPDDRGELFGDSRVVSEGTPQARLHVGVDGELEALANDPGLRLVSEWRSMTTLEVEEMEDRVAELDEDLAAGRIEPSEHAVAVYRIRTAALDGGIVYAAAVYVDTTLPG